MSQKLEDRLLLYERDHPIRNDQELIAAIEVILDEQDSLPIKKRDFDLIAEATETVLKLQGYSEEQLTEMADEAVSSLKARIASQQDTPNTKPKARRRVLRWLIPIVAIIILSTAVVASSTNSLSISDIAKHIYASLQPKTKYSEENVDIVVSNEISAFLSFSDLANSVKQPILLPYDMENDLQNLAITQDNYGEFQHILISFDYCNTSCMLSIDYPVQNSSMEYNAKIGSYEVFEYSSEDGDQAVWINSQICYSVKTNNASTTNTIIEQMRTK